jgi:hypothetical protein
MMKRTTLRYLLLLLLVFSWLGSIVTSQDHLYYYYSRGGKKTISRSHQRILKLGKNPVYRDQAEESCKIVSGSLVRIHHGDIIPAHSLNYGLFWALCLDEMDGNSIGMYKVQSNECISENLGLNDIRMYALCQLDWEKSALEKLMGIRMDREVRRYGFRGFLLWLNGLRENRSFIDPKLKDTAWNNKSTMDKKNDFQIELELDPAIRSPTMSGRRKSKGREPRQQQVVRDDEMIWSRQSRQILDSNKSTSSTVPSNTTVKLTKENIQIYSRYHCVFGSMAFISFIISIIAFFMEICLYCRKRDELEVEESKSQGGVIYYLTKDVWIAFFLHIFHVLVSLVLFGSAICAWAEIVVFYDDQLSVNGEILYAWFKWVIDLEISKYLCPATMVAFFCALFARLAFMCSQNFLISCNYENHPRGCCGCSLNDNEQQQVVTTNESPFRINYQQIILWCGIFIVAVGGSFLLYRFDLLGPTDGISIYGLFWIKDHPSLFFTAAIIKFVVFVLPSALVIPIWLYMFCMFCCNPCNLRSISDKNLLEQTRHAILVSTVMMVFIATADVIEFLRLAWGEANGVYNYIFIPILTGSQLLLCFFFSVQPIFFSFYGYHRSAASQRKTQ